MNRKTNNVEYGKELHRLIDDVSKLVSSYESRGYVPTFSIKAGVIGMVAVFRKNATKGTGRRGRPRKSDTPSVSEPSVGESV